MWEDLQEIDKQIDKMRDRVRKATEPVSASARELVTMIAQEITCVEDDLTDRPATFYNGSSDSYLIHRLSVNVTFTTPLAPLQGRIPTDRRAFGYAGEAFGGEFLLTAALFDFQWNYLVSSRQSSYSRQFIGSSVFNGLERSQAFDLYEPLIIKPADSVEFILRPIMYLLPGTEGKTPGTTYFVNFLAFGYRRPL